MSESEVKKLHFEMINNIEYMEKAAVNGIRRHALLQILNYKMPYHIKRNNKLINISEKNGWKIYDEEHPDNHELEPILYNEEQDTYITLEDFKEKGTFKF